MVEEPDMNNVKAGEHLDAIMAKVHAKGRMEDCRKEYEDWCLLLKKTKSEDLLQDPFAVWEEAWHVARMTQK
jgi:transcriptional regulator